MSAITVAASVYYLHYIGFGDKIINQSENLHKLKKDHVAVLFRLNI